MNKYLKIGLLVATAGVTVTCIVYRKDIISFFKTKFKKNPEEIKPEQETKTK